jgi:hypothetical protein
MAPEARSSTVAGIFREWVAPCGIVPVRRLESVVEKKLAAIGELDRVPDDRFPDEFDRVVRGVASARAYRFPLVDETPPENIRALLREARAGHLGPADLPALADRLTGAPGEVRLDVASELLHGAVPDRMALLARWVWNPARGTGVLSEFGRPASRGYPGAQTRLGEIRLELGALGFPCASFAGVDVVLALTYAARLQQTSDSGLRSGGLESLLPGVFPLATMILGVRRRIVDADR